MESSTGLGFMAVVAVSGSVAFMALQIHKHLLSEFMKKAESELGGRSSSSCQLGKKKVRFAEDVVEPKSNNKEYRKRSCNGGSLCVNNRIRTAINGGNYEDDEMEENYVKMPLNRLAFYKEIAEYNLLKRHSVSASHC